ncbi:MAG: hypothetical protein HDR77_11030 [Bacteroides sp.]|nr:hypothetical protein [Bacteroides sp.]
MANPFTSRFDDRLLQLKEEVISFFKMCYDPEKNKWKNLDSRLRFIEEHIGGIIIFDIVGETDGHNEQITVRNGSEEIAHYGIAILNTAVKICTTHGITASPDKIKDDLSNHNSNSHGGDITSVKRETEGKKSVTDSLDVLVPYMTVEVQKESGFSTKLKEEFLNLGNYLKSAQRLLSNLPVDAVTNQTVTDAVCEFTGHDAYFPSGSDYDYVMILPESPDESFIDALQPLTAVKWTIIADPGYADGKIYSHWYNIENGDINDTELMSKLSDVKLNWLFINGRIRGTKKKEVHEIFKKLSTHPLRLKNIIIFDLCSDKTVSTNTIKRIWDLFNPNSDRDASDNSTIFSIGRGCQTTVERNLREEGYCFKYKGLDVTPINFVKSLVEGHMIEPEPIYGFTRLRNPQRYLEAGIKFLDTDSGSERKSISEDFYWGQQITKRELEEDKDVHPRGRGTRLRDFRDKIKDALIVPEGQVFTLHHQPGAGGTTVARRLAWELEQNMQNPGALTAIISRYDAIRTVDMLSNLAEETGDRTNILVILDDKEINESEFKNIRTDLRKKGVVCVFLRLRHRMSKDASIDAGNDFFLSSHIENIKEKRLFDAKFSSAFQKWLSTKAIEEIIEEIESSGNRNQVEMIYYPYAFCDRVQQWNRSVSFVAPDSYVSKWFESIESDELRDFCGYTALIYRFTASKGTNLYSLASLWQTDERATLASYPESDQNAMSNILKITQEESVERVYSNMWAPRYAAFTEKILNTWCKTWRDTLSELAINLIDVLPDKLIDGDKELLMDLFILQTQVVENMEDRRDYEDRFSPLIRHILKSREGVEGASNVFKKLMEKYPEDGYYKIHYARLKFEYAASHEALRSDANFKEALTMINEVLTENDDKDDFQHIAGMYWRRIAKTIFRRRNDTAEDTELIIDDIRQATDKALTYFNRCNELNHGISVYGFVSTAELLCSTLKDVSKLLPPEQKKSFLDIEPFSEYLFQLDDTLTHLSRAHFEVELRERKDKIESIRNDFLTLLGNLDDALNHAKSQYKKAEDSKTKKIFGHRTISLMLIVENGEQRMSRLQIYTHMKPELLKELTEILRDLADDGDLMSAENVFHLYRYTRHDYLGEGDTFSALKKWYSMACTANNLQHKLMSSFYMYVSYAIRILNNPNERDINLEDNYKRYRSECRELVEKLDEERYMQIAFAGNEYINLWDCVLDPAEAYTLDPKHQRNYSSKCRRENAVIKDLEGTQGDCWIGTLKKISFSRKGLHEDSKGKMLTNGVVGFRFRGIGLYDFSTPASVHRTLDRRTLTSQYQPSSLVVEKAPSVSEVQAHPVKAVEKSAPEIYRTETEIAGIKAPKVIGKIDLSKIKK